MDIDFTNIEFRVATNFYEQWAQTQDMDVHTAVSLFLFGEATPASRRKAKAVNFGSIYGTNTHRFVHDEILFDKEVVRRLCRPLDGQQSPVHSDIDIQRGC